jgi:signal transduction histidine kinase
MTLTSIIAKRKTMHRQLSQHQRRNTELEAQALQLESLANLGLASAIIAHEINNLLTPLSNYAVLALQNPEDRALAERSLRKTASNCRHAGKVMESILTMANATNIEKVDTPLLPLVKGVFDCLCRDFNKDSITVEIKVPDDLRVRAVPEQLQQALMNLILNAREAMLPKGGKLTIEAQEFNDNVVIRIRDTGRGVEQAEIAKVFDSFFSTKRKSGGNGLGLALCKKVIDAHNGSISVDSLPNQGTTFTITLMKK